MGPTSRRPVSEWIAENIHTLVIVSVLVGGWVANFATISTKINEHERRLATLEAIVVPRSEIDTKDKLMEKRLDDIKQALEDIKVELRNQHK